MVGADRSVLVRLRADISDFQRKFAAAGSEAGAFTRRLEEADGRMANLVQTGLALAPALVPIGALAVPALAGLTQQLGLTAAAAGVTLLAFQGVGDALKALNDYQIDPTEAHLRKLNETMDAIGPSGQIFVRTLQDLRPEMQKLQDVAEQGMFPGLTESIHELLQLQPEVEHIIGTIATGLGDIAADAADGLNDQRWVDFIGWLDSEATPTLKAMASALGYTFEGLASMMQEFDPLADGFTNGMVDYARSFRSWADGLDQTDGFKEFVDYIQTNGPEAMSTLGALARALLDLVSAAAPVGAAALPVIEALAHGLSALAESNVGPTLITAAAAIGVLGRSLAILRAVGLRGDGDSILGRALNVDSMKSAVPAMREAAAATAELQAAESAATAAHTRYIGSLKASSIAGALIPGRVASENMVKVTDELVAANQRQTTAAERARVAEEKRAAAVSKSLSGIGRAAGVVGGLAFATSGLSDDMGLANTATYAMLGTIAGPWGSAIGGAIGLTQDLAGANNDLAQAVRIAQRAMADGSDIAAMQEAIAGLDSEITSFQAKLTVQRSWNPLDLSMENVSAVTAGLNELFTHTQEEAQQTRDELQETTKDALVAVNGLGQALGQFDGGTFTDDVAELAPVLQRVQPALEHMGLTVADLGDAVADGSFPELSRQIVGYLRYADSAEGRTRALANSMSEANDEMVSTADAAADLAASLDALLGPGLNLSQATDQWADGLDHLKDNLAKTGRSLEGQTDASRKNREAIRDQVTNLVDLLKAQADAGAGAGKLARQMRTGKQAILETAGAANLSKDEVRAFFKQLGLGPKVIKTLIDMNVDPAVRKHRQMMADLKELDRFKAVPHVDADTAAAEQNLGRVQQDLAAIVSKSVTVTVNRVASGLSSFTGFFGDSAEGSTVPKDGGHYADRYPYLLAPGEEVISNRNGQADRHRPLLKAINAGRLADGGTAGRSLDSRLEIAQLLQQMRDIHRELAATIKKGPNKGQHQLTGIDRELAALQLQVAQRDLIRAKHADEREAAQAAREKAKKEYEKALQTRRDVRSTSREFDLTGDMSPGDVRDAFEALRDAVKGAGGSLPANFKDLKNESLILSKGLTKANKEYDATTQALTDMRSAAEDFGAGVGNIFNNDIFAKGGLSNAMLQLQADTNDTNERDDLLKRIAALGIDTTSDAFKSLASSADLQTLRDLDTAPEIKAFEAWFDQRTTSQDSAGAWATQVAFQPAIDALVTSAADQKALIADLTTSLEALQEKAATSVLWSTWSGTAAGAQAGVIAGFAGRQKKSNSKARTR